MPGTLFVVATPIGNLEDLTFRALRTLREVDLIAAEDTRRTSKLLAHYEIRKPLVSLHEHNEGRESPRLVARLEAGESIAVVSDAGTPGIADPGAHLVAQARAAGIPIVPIPGPSAVAAALSVSGFSADSFVFLGFPPSSGAARERWMERLASNPSIVVLFEAPHRVGRTLVEIRDHVADRPIFLARELSKIHEELVFSHNETFTDDRGEFVVIVGPAPHGDGQKSDLGFLFEVFGRATNGRLSDDEAVVATAALTGVSPSLVRKAVKKGRIQAKRETEPS